MASELRVDTLKDSSGNNSVGMAYISNGSIKVWANYEQEGTHSTRDSFNVSSLTDDSLGRSDVNFTNAMSNDDFSATMYLNASSGTQALGYFANTAHGGLCRRTTGKATCESYSGSGYVDSGQADLQVAGDLA